MSGTGVEQHLDVGDMHGAVLVVAESDEPARDFGQSSRFINVWPVDF